MLRWSWMNVLTKKRYDALLGKFGSLEKALENINEEMLRELGCRGDTALNTLTRLEELDPQTYESHVAKRGLSLVSIEDDAYPAALRTIGDPPIFLYWKGDVDVLKQPCIGLVGTRDMTDYGKRVTEHIVPGIVRAGVVTVSGLAYGIDAHVAKETLSAGGRTVAVLGHGLGLIYPKANAALAKEIVEKGGLLLSEFPLDVSPDKFTFPARNRIIAGLSLATVVLEASEDSGSLITADLALDYGRDVFAVPGQIFDPSYAGCHRIISRGLAKLATTAEEILQEVGIVSSTGSAEPQLKLEDLQFDSAQEQAIFKALTTMPKPVDDLLMATGLDAGTASASLTMLEMRGLVKNVGGGKWVRV